MEKVWIDVSHILGWKGNLTGIERVEYHIIKHYFEHTEASFVVWQDTSKKFQEITRNEVNSNIIDRTSERELTVDSATSILHKARKLRKKLFVKKVSYNVPGKLIILAGLWDNEAYIAGLQAISKNTKLVHVVFDMIPLVKQEYVVDWLPGVYGKYMYSVLPCCTKILAISKTSAEDTARVLKQKGLRVPAISTFRLGDDITRAPKAIKPDIAIEGSFILSVGTIEVRKNHKLLYELCKRAVSQGIELPTIIIAGRRGWKTEAFQKAVDEDASIKGKLIILDKTTDANLRWLYENCLFTVFPSFYEGWGLPIAESLGYGKVTLASNISSMPEVGGDFADYFSPDSINFMFDLVMRYLNKNNRKQKESYIKKTYKPAKWADAVKRFSDLVENK